MAKILVDTDSVQTLTNKNLDKIFLPSALTSAALQTAIDAAGAAGGGVVQCDPGEYSISSTVTNTYNNVMVRGRGAGANRSGADDSGSAATILKWTGAAGGTMYDLGPAVNAPYNVTGGGIDGIFFNGNKVAGTAVNIRSTRNCTFNMVLAETTGFALTIGVEPTVTTDPGDTQNNWFERLIIIQQDAASGGCIQLNGALTPVANANTSGNHFGHLRLLNYNGTALDLVRCDSNLFDHVMIFRAAAGTGWGVIFHAGTAPSYARSNSITHLIPSGGSNSVLSQGTASGTQPAIKNTIAHFNHENVPDLPTVELGSSLSYLSSLNGLRISRASTNAIIEMHTSRNTVAASSGRFQFVAHDSANAEKVYGWIDGRIVTNTAGSEDGEVRVTVKIGGTDTVAGGFAAGWTVGTAPTGGALGGGTLNASGNLFKNGGALNGTDTVTYSASMTPNQRNGAVHRITITDANAFTINNPTNAISSNLVYILLRNTSGGAHGAITWGANYKMAGALPAIATGNSRTILFFYDGTNFVEMFRSAADVAN